MMILSLHIQNRVVLKGHVVFFSKELVVIE
jgi:hypothetical protein